MLEQPPLSGGICCGKVLTPMCKAIVCTYVYIFVAFGFVDADHTQINKVFCMKTTYQNLLVLNWVGR